MRRVFSPRFSTVTAAADSTAPDAPIDQKGLLSAALEDEPITYSGDDVLLYALGVGFGDDPDQSRELAYVYRQPLLKTVPTLATMLPKSGFPSADHGWDGQQAIHAEHKLELFRPLPASARLLANRRVVDVTENRDGAVVAIVVQAEVRMTSDETALFALLSTLVAGSHNAYKRALPAAFVRNRLPKRDPDLSCDIRTRPDHSLLFSLSGDHNSLYTDPATASRSGFESPLLHGRCVLGIACRAILRTICDYDYTLIRGMEARLSGPVFPGDTVTTDMWQDRNVISFRCAVRARRAIVLESGRCTLAG
jgi:acyl dehydratase